MFIKLLNHSFMCTELASMSNKISKFGVGTVSSETYNFKINSYQSQISEKKETYVLAGINVTSPIQNLSILTAKKKKKKKVLFCFVVLGTPPFFLHLLFVSRVTWEMMHQGYIQNWEYLLIATAGTRCKLECQLFILTHSQQFHTQARSF